MSIRAKLAALACACFTVAGLLIKLYFIPATDRYLEESVRNEMIRDVHALERMILIVVSAAGGNKDTVRRALDAITRDPGIPVELRRSPFIVRQYGVAKDKSPRDGWEEAVVASGTPAFRATEEVLQYAYPLKARAICGGCHQTAAGAPVPHGTVLGLAVKTVPRSVLRDSSLVYFVMDLFWHNLVMVGLLIGVLLFGMAFWVLSPVSRLAQKAEDALARSDEELPPGRDELETIGRGLELAAPEPAGEDTARNPGRENA